MNKITGIIAEFNPFHKGHEYLLNQIEGIKIVAMSGNWMQRGEPAIFDKWTRAQMALACGADLVVELPVTVSAQAADFFCKWCCGYFKKSWNYMTWLLVQNQQLIIMKLLIFMKKEGRKWKVTFNH